MGRYNYKLYNTGFTPRRYLMDISANNPCDAIRKAGFDWIVEAGGSVVKTRRGRGCTNTAILVYAPEDLGAEEPRPEFVLERQF